MNPFMHETVAQPLGSRALRWSRKVGIGGLAALAWAGLATAVDLNVATLEELQGIRGIGPKTARIIIEERDRAGRYMSFEDLSDRVRGIGPKRAQALEQAGLKIGSAGAGPKTPALAGKATVPVRSPVKKAKPAG